MKKHKKLTRKGLDELANEMPQVNEIQQRECVGGAIFFDIDGGFIYGCSGPGDELRVCHQDEWFGFIAPGGFETGSGWVSINVNDYSNPLAFAQNNIEALYLGVT